MTDFTFDFLIDGPLSDSNGVSRLVNTLALMTSHRMRVAKG